MESYPPKGSPDPAGRFPWRPRAKDLGGILALFLVTRLLLAGVGVLAWGHQLTKSNWRGVDRSGIHYALVPDQPLLDMWTRWDSWEYEEIARKGYWFEENAKPQPYGTVACFPLYPLTIRALGTLIGGRFVLAGLVVSNLSAFVGFLLLFQWATWWGDRGAAWLTVSAAITFPAGLFWSALYPQSLFFALSLGALTLMLDGRTGWACICGSLATATRLEGVAIIPALLWILVENRRRLPRLHEVFWLSITPLGLLSYMAYLAWRWGDPVLFLSVHKNFGRGLANPIWTLLQPLFPFKGFPDQVIPGTYAVLGLILLGHFAGIRKSVLAYAWILLLIPLSTGVFTSIYRVHLVNAPIYLAIGLAFRGGWKFLGWGLVAVFFWLECVMMFNWVSGYFLP